ncbi:GNAT family N-acetyltransferase [Streptomyces sp. 058-1L]|uniref:GNAT family N-acetyltransferase n=1 Tax=Streptomyces sp. 058-1L TaxID=2789266 RepID=UPI003981467A
MAVWHVRDFVAEDLEGVVRLDGESRTSGEPAVFRLSEVVAALQRRNPGVVAVADGHLVGAAAGRVDGDRAWVLRVALHPAWRNLGLGTGCSPRWSSGCGRPGRCWSRWCCRRTRRGPPRS